MSRSTFIIGTPTSGLTMTIHRRSHADASDYWDGNWLAATVEVAAGRFRASIPGDIRAEEVAAFLDQLKRLRQSLRGDAEFHTMEEWLGFKLTGNGRGQIDCEGFIMDEAGIGNRLTFQLAFDQTCLDPLVRDLDSILSGYPVIGRP